MNYLRKTISGITADKQSLYVPSFELSVQRLLKLPTMCQAGQPIGSRSTGED